MITLPPRGRLNSYPAGAIPTDALPVRRVAWPTKPGIEHTGFTDGRCIDAGIREEINRGGVVQLVAFIGQSTDHLMRLQQHIR